MNQNKSDESQEILPENDFWLLRLFSTLFQSGKIQDHLRENSKVAAILADRFMRYTCTYNPILRCICQGAKAPDQHHKLFCTLQCTGQQRERHLLGEVLITPKEARVQRPGWWDHPALNTNSSKTYPGLILSRSRKTHRYENDCREGRIYLWDHSLPQLVMQGHLGR